MPPEELRQRLPEGLERALRNAGSDAGVYLVGGAVRDFLLGKPIVDVDVAVEGDAVGLGRALARELGGPLTAHSRFGTAVVRGGGGRIDVVTARSESYPEPAALPVVEPGSIGEDLARRDFSVNAMAVSLGEADFGRLLDPFDGRADLGRRVIRVLHPASFSDDPTRILRAVRYESRLGFRMETVTEELARAALEAGFLARLSGARIRDELILLLEEEEAPESIVRLGGLGVAEALQPCLAADDEAAAISIRSRGLLRRYALELPPWRAGMAVLSRRLGPGELTAWLEGLRLRRRDADGVAAAVVRAPLLLERLAGQAAPDPAEVLALAHPGAPDAPLLALAERDLPALHDYFERLRHTRLEIDGGDLASLGLAESRRVGEVLAELERRKLNGELDGRDAELEAARDLIAGGPE